MISNEIVKYLFNCEVIMVDRCAAARGTGGDVSVRGLCLICPLDMLVHISNTYNNILVFLKQCVYCCMEIEEKRISSHQRSNIHSFSKLDSTLKSCVSPSSGELLLP